MSESNESLSDYDELENIIVQIPESEVQSVENLVFSVILANPNLIRIPLEIALANRARFGRFGRAGRVTQVNGIHPRNLLNGTRGNHREGGARGNQRGRVANVSPERSLVDSRDTGRGINGRAHVVRGVNGSHQGRRIYGSPQSSRRINARSVRSQRGLNGRSQRERLANNRPQGGRNRLNHGEVMRNLRRHRQYRNHGWVSLGNRNRRNTARENERRENRNNIPRNRFNGRFSR
jgi:hypothetical protein